MSSMKGMIYTGMIYSREGMRHQCWSLVIVSTERGRQVGNVVLHHGLPRSRGSPVYRRGHGEMGMMLFIGT